MPSDLRAPGGSAGARDLGGIVGLWGRSLGPSALVVLAAVGAMAVALLPLYVWAANATLLLGFRDAEQISPRQLTLLVVVVLVPFCIVLALLTATVVGGVAIVAARLAQGLPARPMGAFRAALRSSPRLVVVLAVVLASILVAFVATPFLVLAGVVALVLTPVARAVQRRWARLPWPATRSLVVVAVPFGLAAALVVRWALVLPAVVLERGSIRAAFSRSVELTRSQTTRVAVVAVAFLLAPVVVLSVLDARFVADATAVVGPQLVSTLGGLLVLTLGVAAAAYLFTQLGEPADLAFVEVPPPGRDRSVGALLVVAVLAATAPVGYVVGRAAPAEATGATFVVDTLGDAPDADPGDGLCDVGDGSCTLRAALGEANASVDETIGFAVSGTITVESTLRIASPLTIDGSGRRVTVSGGGSVGVFATAIEVSGGGSATIRALTIADGFDGSTGGGAVFNSSASGGEGLVLDGVTVRDTVTGPGAMFGGAIVNTSKLTVRNSTFSGNDADAGTDGSDIANVFSGRATISQSTFAGSSGSSAVSSTSDDPAAITNSIVTGAGFACSGTFTGSGNVTTDAEAVCPGAAGATTATLGLAAPADNGGPTDTVRLLPGSLAIDAGGAGACTAADQRGASRPKGTGCDAGAYELDPATTTSLTATPADAPFGGTVTVTAAVTATGEPVVPTGTVELFDGAASLGTVALVDGSASKALTTLSAGSHDLKAAYRPDSGLASSTSAVKTVTVQRATSTVTLTSSGSPTGGGEAVSFQVRVTSPGASVPTGSVTVKDGTTPIGTVALDAAGRAEVVTSALAGGPHVIVADYAGDANHAPASSAALGHEVVGGTTIALQGPSAPTVFGNDAVFEVEVAPVAGGRTPTGLVTLFTGPTPVGFANLDASATASIPVTVLPPGTSSVYAAYEGDGYNGASTSATVDHVVSAAETRTSLVVAPSASTVFGTAVTIDVAVTAVGTPAVPSGTVAISDGTRVITRVSLEADGTSSSTLPNLPAGRYALHAVFDGATGLDPSTSTATDHEVRRASTAVTLAAGSAGSVSGELVSLTADATSTNSGFVPAGSVTFRDGATVLGTVALDGTGVARLDTRGIAVGSRTLTATFDGSADFAPATSSGLAHVVARADAQVAIVAAPTRTWFGTAVAIDVVVTAAAPGSGQPTGSVTVRDGETVLGMPALDGDGRATLTVSTLAVGERTLHGDYAGDASFRSGTASTSHTVDADATTVTVQTSEPEQVYGRPVTLTAVVQSAGGLVPTGTVTFTGGSRTLGVAPLDASGRASVTVADLPVGSTLVEGAYGGDGSFAPGSGQRLQRVTSSPTSTALVVEPSAPTVADVVTLTATVTAPGAQLRPAGLVEFVDGAAVIGTAALDGDGKAALSRRFNRSSHELRARFVATTSWQASSSASQTIAPARVGASLALTATPGSALIGTTVRLRATVPTAAGVAAPTGVINFTDASGGLGTAPIVDGVATLDVTAPVAPGPWIVSGWYPGDLNYEPVAPTATTIEVAASPTILAVVTTPNPGFALDGAVTVRAHVAAGSGSAPITGKVRFASDSPALSTETATVDAEGFAEITIHDVPAGTWNVLAEYLPATGSGFAGSTAATTHTSVKRSAAVAITGATGLQAGRPTRVSAAVTDPAGSGRTPSGSIRIDAGPGLTCTAAAPSGTCDLVLPAAGPVTLTATYRGDDRFLGTTGSFAAVVTASTPTLRASSPTRPWITGDPITIDWTLAGPTSGTVVVRSPFGVACTVPAAPSGSCTATVPFEQRGATFDIDVAYSGDGTWDPAFASVTGTVKGCYPVPFTGLPAGGGTVVGGPGNCNRGTGFVDGTPVTAMAAPAPGYVLSRWLETDSTALAYRFVVGEETRSATALFELDCVTVAYRAGQAPNIEPAGSANGRVELSAPPDCGVPDQRDPDSGTTTSRFRRGTTLQATAVASSPDTGQFKGWVVNEATGASSYPTAETIDLELTGDVDLTAGFGARCYRPEVVAEGTGSARIGTAPNCFDAVGPGFVFGTDVAIEATPGARHYVGAMRTAAGGFVAPTAYGIRSDDAVIVTFDPCKQLTTGTTGSGRGSIEVSTPSTCPGGEPGYYVPGEITLTPVSAPGYSGKLGLPVEGDRFKRWIGDEAAPIFERSNPLRLDMSQDRTVTAVFTSPSRCATVDLATQSPDWIGGLQISQDPAIECDGPDQYLQGEPFTLTASALQGAPLIQWKVTGLADFESAALSGKSTKIPTRTGYRSHVAGAAATSPPMYGDVTATAYACAALTSDVTLLGEDGSPAEGEAPDGFVRYDAAPSCPGTGNGWLVGDTVGYFAGAQPAGYDFDHWEGDVAGTEAEGSITLDGSKPEAVIRPVYQVTCYSLAVTPEANTVRGVDPNCPGADPAANRYVGGTVVALHAFDGGEVWVGWQGDVARPENPTWVYVDRDATAHAKWRSKTTNEKIEDFFTDVADVLAVGAKKLVGVAIVAASVLLESTVTVVLGLVTLAATAIDAIAGALGAPSSGEFREAMAGIQQTAALFSSPFSCGAEWAFADASEAGPDGSNPLDGDGGDAKKLIKKTKKVNAQIEGYRASIDAIEETSSGYMASLKKFAVQAKVAKSVGSTALTTAGIGTQIATGEVGFEDTAEEAWGNESGRAFMSCMEQSFPDYWNVPPLGFTDS